MLATTPTSVAAGRNNKLGLFVYAPQRPWCLYKHAIFRRMGGKNYGRKPGISESLHTFICASENLNIASLFKTQYEMSQR